MGRRSTPTAILAATLLVLTGCAPAGPEFLPVPSGQPVPTPTGEFGGQELPTDDAIADFAHGRMNFPQPPRGILLQKKNLGEREA